MNKDHGLVFRSFIHLFQQLEARKNDATFVIKASYLEIYNENVRDLLGKDQNAKLDVKERPDVGVYVKDLSAYVVNNAEDMDKTMTMVLQPLQS